MTKTERAPKVPVTVVNVSTGAIQRAPQKCSVVVVLAESPAVAKEKDCGSAKSLSGRDADA